MTTPNIQFLEFLYCFLGQKRVNEDFRIGIKGTDFYNKKFC